MPQTVTAWKCNAGQLHETEVEALRCEARSALMKLPALQKLDYYQLDPVWMALTKNARAVSRVLAPLVAWVERQEQKEEDA